MIWTVIKLISGFLTLVGLLFVVLVIAGIIYIARMEPLGIEISPTNLQKALEYQIDVATGNTPEVTESTYDHPLLSPEQEQFIEAIGIDTSTLPTELTEEQIACLTTALGAERAMQLAEGATPNLIDITKSRHCLQ